MHTAFIDSAEVAKVFATSALAEHGKNTEDRTHHRMNPDIIHIIVIHHTIMHIICCCSALMILNNYIFNYHYVNSILLLTIHTVSSSLQCTELGIHNIHTVHVTKPPHCLTHGSRNCVCLIVHILLLPVILYKLPLLQQC